MIAVTYLIRTPMDFLNACVKASVFPISSEKISLPDIEVKGVSTPSDWAMPIAIAVFPVPGFPANSTDRPAIFPSYYCHFNFN